MSTSSALAYLGVEFDVASGFSPALAASFSHFSLACRNRGGNVSFNAGRGSEEMLVGEFATNLQRPTLRDRPSRICISSSSLFFCIYICRSESPPYLFHLYISFPSFYQSFSLLAFLFPPRLKQTSDSAFVNSSHNGHVRTPT